MTTRACAIKAAAAGLLMTLCGAASATTLNGFVTVDNLFTAYLSTDDSVLGTEIGSGTSWPTVYPISGELTSNVTYYLHIVATDQGAPAMFLGDFTLSDTSYTFSNGTQHLLTNAVDWQVSATGFGANYQAPLDLGPDGSGPWGLRPNIDDSARYVWDPSNCGGCTVYFSTPIVSAAPVPVPAALPMLGLALLGLRRYRRK